jgi:hypothetical protein
MSLTKNPRETKASLAARRRNGRLSHGPVTPQGKARCRRVNERHGFYSKSEEAVLRSLGESPADFQAVLEGVRATWAAENPAQEKLLACLARTFCRIELAERAREGHLLRQAKEADDGRETRIHAQMMHLKMTADNLRLLAQAVARRHYVASLDDLKKMKSLHQEGAMKEMGEIALALFFELRLPGTPGLGEEGECEDQMEKARRVVAQVKEIFGIGMAPYPPPPVTGWARDSQPQPQDPQNAVEAGTKAGPDLGPAHADSLLDAGQAQKIAATQADGENEEEEEEEYDKECPCITAKEWAAREPVRQLLENILTHQVDIYEVRREALLKELVAGPSPYERAAETTPPDSFVKLMQRVEDSNLRQASRLIGLLEKMKRQARKTQNRKNARGSGDVKDKKRS